MQWIAILSEQILIQLTRGLKMAKHLLQMAQRVAALPGDVEVTILYLDVVKWPNIY